MTNLLFNFSKRMLNAQINGLSLESRKLKKKLRKTKKVAHQASLQTDKCAIKSHLRHQLLAYGFLRGKNYSSLEQKCRQKPSATLMLKIIENLYPLFNPVTCRYTKVSHLELTNWLNGEKS